MPYSAWRVTPDGRAVIVAVTGAEPLPLVGAPPVLITVISYRPASSADGCSSGHGLVRGS
jgi:hypothetical protein